MNLVRGCNGRGVPTQLDCAAGLRGHDRRGFGLGVGYVVCVEKEGNQLDREGGQKEVLRGITAGNVASKFTVAPP